MVKKLVVLAVFFMVLCFAGMGCYRGGAHVGGGGGLYYDGPYRFGGGVYYYYDGGFYVYKGGAFRFHHHAPQNVRGNYEEHHRKNREQYNRDYHKWRDQNPGHPWTSQREEDRRK